MAEGRAEGPSDNHQRDRRVPGGDGRDRDFIRERCVHKPELAIRARELFRVYQEWCAENNEQGTSERMFGLRMKELGMAQKRTAEGRYWQGLGLIQA